MDIDASVIDQVGEAVYARWKDAALADLAAASADLRPLLVVGAPLRLGSGPAIRINLAALGLRDMGRLARDLAAALRAVS